MVDPNLETHQEPSFVFKFILVGDSSVGKTAIAKRFCEREFSSDLPQTIGLEFGNRTVSIQENCIRLQIWDTAGQERFRSITRSYFRGSSAVFLVYDITNRESFSHICGWADDSTRLAPLESVQILIGNKSDLDDKRQVSNAEAKDFAEQNRLTLFETSALSGDKIDDAFVETAGRVYEAVQIGKLGTSIYSRNRERNECPLNIEADDDGPDRRGCC
jgi:small GTP-binding protein